MMVNTRDVKNGDELIMEVAAVAAPKRKAQSWKDDAQRRKALKPHHAQKKHRRLRQLRQLLGAERSEAAVAAAAPLGCCGEV